MQGVIEGFRLSLQQSDLWREQKEGGHFLAQVHVAVRGDLDQARLLEAVTKTVGRHEILRTRFECLPGMGMPIQVIGEEPVFTCEKVNLSDQSADAQEARISGLLSEQGTRPFDFARPGLLRLHLMTLFPEEHVLLLTLPALCADTRSLGNLVKEIAYVYRALPGEAGLAEDFLQYVQFSEWQHELQEEPDAEEGRAFWDRQTGQHEAPLRLPYKILAGTSPEPVADPWAHRVVRQLDHGWVAAARRLAEEHGATLESLLLTIWGSLLLRVTGAEELTLETLSHGRKFTELEDALGLFGRYLPITFQTEMERPFAKEMVRLAECFAEACKWEEFYRPATPRAAIGFDFDETASGDEDAEDVRFSADRVCYQGARFKLRLSVRLDAENLKLEFQYDPGYFRGNDIERLAGQLHTLSTSAMARPLAPVGELEILSHEDRELLARWQGCSAQAPARLRWQGELRLPRLFSAQVERTPEAIALMAEGSQVSFREFDRRANRLARHLLDLEVTTESRVALLFERSVDMIVGLLGVSKSGAAFLPLDPWQPRERLVQMLEDSATTWVLSHRHLADELPREGIRTLLLDTERSAIDRRDSTDPAVEFDSMNLAYVIYTSGSTGRPKGTLVEHRSLANLAHALTERIYANFSGAAPLRVSVNAPLAFDAAVKQVIQLLAGHRLLLVPDEVRVDGEALLAWIRRHGIDVFDCTPSHLRLLADVGLSAPTSHGLPRLVLIGGEAIDTEQWGNLVDDSQRHYYNVYGPTECTVDAVSCRITGPVPTIGTPLAGVGIGVLDERQRQVPVGVGGELVISGAGVSRGYLNRPGLTAERFLPDPFTSEPGTRLYRTGDRACFLSDGQLTVDGRLDRQVKVRGARVELGEIESALSESPKVKRSVALLRDDRLVTYVVPHRCHGTRIDGRARHTLPNGMAITHQNRNETDYLYQEIFENRCYAQHGIHLPEKACVFDVGSNIGMFTLFVHQECRHPRIYAFEPLPPILETLRLNCDLYASPTSVKIFGFGLSKTPTTERFTFYPKYTMMSGQSEYANPVSEVEVVKRFLENQRADGLADSEALLERADEILEGRFEGEEIQVELRRLSDVMREECVDHIDLLKVDVQRAELEVLQGIDDDDWSKIDQVVLEVHDAPGEATEGRVDQILALLREHRFEAVAEQDHLLVGTDRYNLYASRGGLEQASTRDGQITPPRSMAGPLGIEELREFARQRLPEYMLPNAFVLVDELPLNRHGKVDLSALSEIEEVEIDSAAEVTAPRTPYEEVLVGVWTEVLGVEHLGVDESFFDLGGHSLLATQLMSRVRETFEVELALRTLFEVPTIEHLAAKVEQALEAGEGVLAPPIEPVPRGGRLELSFAEQRLWFLQQIDPLSPSYNSPKAVRMSGDLDVAVLARTLTEISRRHEILRTTYPSVEGEASVKIGANEAVHLPVVDLADLTLDESQDLARQWISREALRPFDLARGPLLRYILFRTGESEHIFLLVTHHIITDGWSLSVLIREVAALYTAILERRPSPLADPVVQYTDFAQWQRRWLSGDVLEKELEYWRRQLGGKLPDLAPPPDHPRPTKGPARGAQLTLRLPEKVASGISELSRREGVTLYMSFLAVFLVLLSRYCRQDDVTVGVPVAGRNRRETEGLVGFFINMLLLRLDLSAATTFRDLLQRVRNATLGAYAHQDLPFDKLVEELHPERSSGSAPLVRVCIGLQNLPQESFDLTGLQLRSVAPDLEFVRHDLTLWLSEAGPSVDATWTYNSGLYEASSIEQMHARFETLLHRVLAQPAIDLKELEMLTEAEKAEFEDMKKDLKAKNRKKFLSSKPKAKVRDENASEG